MMCVDRAGCCPDNVRAASQKASPVRPRLGLPPHTSRLPPPYSSVFKVRSSFDSCRWKSASRTVVVSLMRLRGGKLFLNCVRPSGHLPGERAGDTTQYTLLVALMRKRRGSGVGRGVSSPAKLAEAKQSNQCKTESRHNQSLGRGKGGARDDALQYGKCRNIGIDSSIAGYCPVRCWVLPVFQEALFLMANKLQ